MSETGASRLGSRGGGAWWVVLALLLAAGVGLRVYRFPAVPDGLNQDEAAAGYEAFSLLETGKDRWGNRCPPYFPAWGSGQSVLLSYLTVPFVAVLGPSPLAVRLPSLLVGLVTLPLFVSVVASAAGRPAGMLAGALLAVSAWHVMLSRWSLDANLLPFTLLLACWVFERALRGGGRYWRLLAFVPFAISFYSYGMAVVVMPLLLLGLLAVNRREVAGSAARYLPGALLGLALALPFLLFLVKNHVVKADLGIERLLPFDVPLLPATRFDQRRAPTLPVSAEFVLAGLRDDLPWNNLPDERPLPELVLGLALLGLLTALGAARGGERLDPFVLWLLAGVPVLLLAPANVTRANALYLPILALAARGAVALDTALGSSRLRSLARAAGLGVIVLHAVHFGRHYFGDFSRTAAQAFNRGLDDALPAALAAARPDEKVVISSAIPLNYVYLLFYGRVPPARFQKAAVYETIPGRGYDVHRLDNVYFRKDLAAAAPGGTVFLLRATEDTPCAASEVAFEDKWWRVYRCPAVPVGPAP